MTQNRHECSLYLKFSTDLPRLAPNAHWINKLGRGLRKLVLINPDHSDCVKLFRNKSIIMKERRKHATGPYYFVIHPLSYLNTIMEALFILVWLYFIIMEPLILFADEEFEEIVMNIHRKVISSIQLVLILPIFNTGYVDKSTKQVILEPKKIICRYLFTYFIFDYMSTYLAADIPVLILKEDIDKYQHAKLYAYLFRVFALSIRIPTLINYVNDILKNIKIKKMVRSIICYCVKTYIILHLFAFLMVMVPVLSYEDDNFTANVPMDSWLRDRICGFLGTKKYQAYFNTLRLVFCFFFGISYKIMNTMIEQMCAVVISFTGRLYTLYLVADILRLFGIAGISQSVYQRNISIIENYMADQNLPENLKQRMLRYCQFKFEGRYLYEDKIKNTLSKKLRAELFLFSARKMIYKAEVFKSLPRSIVGAVMEVMKLEIFSPNDIIISIGSETSEVYFISSGTVAVTSLAGNELCHLTDGEEFGTSCLFFRQQKFAILAIEPTEVFIINKNEFMEFLYPYPDIMNKFYRSAKERVAKLETLDDAANVQQVNLLTELKRGHILEKQTIRTLRH